MNLNDGTETHGRVAPHYLIINLNDGTETHGRVSLRKHHRIKNQAILVNQIHINVHCGFRKGRQ
jgi:hypothetical protein